MSEDQNLGGNPEETPEETPDSMQDYLKQVFGKEAADMFQSLEPDPMTEAWIAFHEFYRGLISGGFTRAEAVDITSAYLYRIMVGGGGQN